MRFPRGGAVVAVVAVAVVAVTAGCGGSGDGGADLTRVETAHVRLGFPKTWQRQDEGGRLSARKSVGGRTVAQVVVLERVVKASTADLAVNAAQAGRFLQPDYQRGKLTTVEIKGADDARKLTYTYTSTEGGARQPAGGTDVVALLDRDAHLVRITGLQGQLEQREVDAIVSSIELKEK
ncbi:hypothetical protein ACSNOI_25570 [Actinomadura kijaniata]|uniref:hypothetical protein n=1 Tax=Actinomadura kijaniata TaxID=46161 RepID=UPI003F1DCE9E